MENALKQSSPSQLDSAKPVSKAGFDILNVFGDWMGTEKKHIIYTPAEIKRGKKWFITFKFRHPETGAMIRFKKYHDINRKKGQAQVEYAELLRMAYDERLRRGYSPFEKPKLQVAVKNWSLIQGLNLFKQNLDNRGLRKRSVQSYQSVLRMLYKELDAVKNEDIRRITKSNVGSALLNAKKRLAWSNTTYNNNLTFTKAIFNYLIEEEILEINPAAKIKSLPQTITKHRYFDDKTFEKIKEKCDKELLDFIMFLYHTGTRPNEARQLYDHHIL